MKPDADAIRAQAALAQRAGNHTAALSLISRAIRLQPERADLHNSAGSIALAAGYTADALKSFFEAHARDPERMDYALNLGIALGRAKRPREALSILEKVAMEGRDNVRYCSLRAKLERDAGDLEGAQRWYAACLANNPKYARGLHGFARVSLERGDHEAVERFDDALRENPADRELLLGKAQALEASMRTDEAVVLAKELASRFHGWVEPLRLLAQIALSRAENDFAAAYRHVTEKHQADRAVILDWIDCLGAAERTEDALELVSAFRARLANDEELVLREARYAGELGDDARAEHAFSKVSRQSPSRWLLEARHRIRLRELAKAEELLRRVIDVDPHNVTAWALRDVGWRLSGDARHHWLHGQPGLVASMPVCGSSDILKSATALLETLHNASVPPMGQSVRGGTQTRGGLFDRGEPLLCELKSAILETLELYRGELPPPDAAHPLLHARDFKWQLVGSWSVRLESGSGRHVAHIHPRGLVSSALYLGLPDPDHANARDEGWLEIGRPADDLRSNLPPLSTLRPEIGKLALFPSTLFHGTRPFGSGRRMTVAFDVAAVSS